MKPSFRSLRLHLAGTLERTHSFLTICLFDRKPDFRHEAFGPIKHLIILKTLFDNFVETHNHNRKEKTNTMKLSLIIASFATLLLSVVVHAKKETKSLRRGIKGGNKNGADSPVSDMARKLDEDSDWDTGDFEWGIQPEEGYPSIASDDTNDTNEGSEVTFKFNFAGTLTDKKFLEVNLYTNDCVTAADPALAFGNTTSGDELDIKLDIIQETITDSVHYQDINGTAGVDYNYVDSDGVIESINFYETNATITVDLTHEFTLTEISADEIIIIIH
jgi:hypothetical protein